MLSSFRHDVHVQAIPACELAFWCVRASNQGIQVCIFFELSTTSTTVISMRCWGGDSRQVIQSLTLLYFWCVVGIVVWSPPGLRGHQRLSVYGFTTSYLAKGAGIQLQTLTLYLIELAPKKGFTAVTHTTPISLWKLTSDEKLPSLLKFCRTPFIVTRYNLWLKQRPDFLPLIPVAYICYFGSTAYKRRSEWYLFTRLSLHIALLKHLRHISSPGGKGSEITVLCHIEDT